MREYQFQNSASLSRKLTSSIEQTIANLPQLEEVEIGSNRGLGNECWLDSLADADADAEEQFAQEQYYGYTIALNGGFIRLVSQSLVTFSSQDKSLYVTHINCPRLLNIDICSDVREFRGHMKCSCTAKALFNGTHRLTFSEADEAYQRWTRWGFVNGRLNIAID